MTVLTFLPRFAPLVRAGTKARTIRANRKRPIKVGDHLSLRRWTGRPYGSPQEILREADCVFVTQVTIERDGIEILGDGYQGPWSLDGFALADGFESWADLVAHFDAARGLPFTGTMIVWAL